MYVFQKDRQTDVQKGIQIDMQKYRQTDMQKGRKAERRFGVRYAQIHAEKKIGSQTCRNIKQIYMQKDRQTYRQTCMKIGK
jgi:hypothetical protein